MANPPIVFADPVIGSPAIYWGAGGSGTIMTGGGRGSPARNALRNPSSLTWSGPAHKLWLAHFAINASTYNHVGKAITVGGQLFVFNSSGTLGWNGGGPATQPLTIGAWEHIMLLVYRDPSAGLISIYVNENLQVQLTGQNTGSGTASQVIFDASDLSTHYDFTDIFFAASDTSTDLPYGDRPVFALMPNGSGANTGLTPNGAASNYQCVDEQPPDDDTTYVSSSVAGTRDSYALADLPSAVDTVYAVIPALYSRKTDAGSRSVAPSFHIGSTDYDGTAVPAGTTYGYQTQVYMTNPATSAAWTPSDVNSLQVGEVIG